MTDLAATAPLDREEWRPNLVPLTGLMLLSCLLAGYFLYDTYLTRTPATQSADNGVSYVLRLRTPAEIQSEVHAGQALLSQTIMQVEQQAATLQAEIAGRKADHRQYQRDIDNFLRQLQEVEQVVAITKQKIGALSLSESVAATAAAPAAAGKRD